MANKKDNDIFLQNIHVFEQASMFVKDSWIPYLKVYYELCLKNGFDKKQAMELTINFQECSLKK